MASPVSKAGFPDTLDPRFREITFNTFQRQKDMIPFFFTRVDSTLETERMSDITPMGDAVEFGGTLTYDGPDQGYDVSATHREFALGLQVERRVWQFDQTGVVDDMFTGLADGIYKKTQKDAARMFVNSFSVDTYFYNHTENVALCSNSHTTPRSVSTASGFDNLATDALSPTALGAAITAFRKLKDLAGERINVLPTLLLVPVDLRERAAEIVKTVSGLDSAEGTINVYKSEYNFQVVDWVYLTDATDWWIADLEMMRKNLRWFDGVAPEFARVEAFEEIIAKYRGYNMYTQARNLWQFLYGSQVSG